MCVSINICTDGAACFPLSLSKCCCAASSLKTRKRLSFFRKGSFNRFSLTQYLNDGGRAKRLQGLGRGGSW